MGIFNFRKNGSQDNSNHSNGNHVNGYDDDDTEVNPLNGQAQADIPENVFVEREALNNIDLLYKFLDGNYEEKGYNDALVNPDASHLEQNIEALKFELDRIIKKVKTFYEDFLREVDYHIESRARNGMIDTVDELRMKKGIAESHLKKVLELEKDVAAKAGDSKGVMISYVKGFKNGLAAISHHTILQRKF